MPNSTPADKKEVSAKNLRPAKAEPTSPRPKLAPVQPVDVKADRTRVIQQKPVGKLVKSTPQPVKTKALPVSESVTLSTLPEVENNAQPEDVQEKIPSSEPAQLITTPLERPPERIDDLVVSTAYEVYADFGQADFSSSEYKVEPRLTVADRLELVKVEPALEAEISASGHLEDRHWSAEPSGEAESLYPIVGSELVDEGHEPIVVLTKDLTAKIEVIALTHQQAVQEKFENIVDMVQGIVDSEKHAAVEAKEALEQAVIEFFEIIDIQYSEKQLKDFIAVILEPGHSNFIKQFAELIAMPSQERGTREIMPKSGFPNLSLSGTLARLATRWQLGKLTLAQAVIASSLRNFQGGTETVGA